VAVAPSTTSAALVAALTHVDVEERAGGLDAQLDDPALIDDGLEDVTATSVTAVFAHGVDRIPDLR
jgi:hypothetical protein